MSARRAGVILWCVLMLLLPLPVWHAGSWGGLPPFKTLSLRADGFWWQGTLAALAVGFMAWLYCRWAERLPLKIRGALVGLLGLTGLIMLSALPVYQVPGEAAARTFIQLYR